MVTCRFARERSSARGSRRFRWWRGFRTVTLIHSSLLLAAGFLLSEVVIYSFRRVPFTSAYNAPASRARLMWPIWFVAFSLFSHTLSFIESRLLVGRVAPAALILAVLAAGIAVRVARERQFNRAPRMLTFDAEEEDAPMTLELFGAPPRFQPHGSNLSVLLIS